MPAREPVLTVKSTKNRWFFSPTQLFTHGQWWSILRMHRLQILERTVHFPNQTPQHSPPDSFKAECHHTKPHAPGHQASPAGSTSLSVKHKTGPRAAEKGAGGRRTLRLHRTPQGCQPATQGAGTASGPFPVRRLLGQEGFPVRQSVGWGRPSTCSGGRAPA